MTVCILNEFWKSWEANVGRKNDFIDIPDMSWHSQVSPNICLITLNYRGKVIVAYFSEAHWPDLWPMAKVLGIQQNVLYGMESTTPFLAHIPDSPQWKRLHLEILSYFNPGSKVGK